MCILKHPNRGQATLELMIVLPAALALALVVTNAAAFLAECAAFDRAARNAVRIYASSPGFNENDGQILESIEKTLRENLVAPNLQVAVAGTKRYPYTNVQATLSYTPTLFGLPMRASLFGVRLPAIEHRISLTVDRYKPGMLF